MTDSRARPRMRLATFPTAMIVAARTRPAFADSAAKPSSIANCRAWLLVAWLAAHRLNIPHPAKRTPPGAAGGLTTRFAFVQFIFATEGRERSRLASAQKFQVERKFRPGRFGFQL